MGLFRELRAHVDDLQKKFDTIGCLVLRGNGKCFSADHDLGDVAVEGEDPEAAKFQPETITRLANLP